MRTITSTLEAYQKVRPAAWTKLVLTKNGEDTITLYNHQNGTIGDAAVTNRLLRCISVEEGVLQSAIVLIDNTDLDLTDIDLRYYKGVLSYGGDSDGIEYSDMAYLWVWSQREITDYDGGFIATSLHMIGIFNRMQIDQASADFTIDNIDDQTVQDLLYQIAKGDVADWTASTAYTLGDIVKPTTPNGYTYRCTTAGTSHSAEPSPWGTTIGGETSEGGGTVVWTCEGSACTVFNHCEDYSIIWDDKDDLADVYVPAESFKIAKGQSRKSVWDNLISRIDAVDRAENDGKIHIFRKPYPNTLRPNAAGDSTDLAPHPNDGEDNYEDVDEETADTTTNVWYFFSTVEQDDLYNIESPSGHGGTIKQVTVYALCGKTDTSRKSYLRIKVKAGGNTSQSDQKEITDLHATAYGTYSESFTTNPADSEAWEWSDIAALQIGISFQSSDDSGANFVRCTQVYCIVEIDDTRDYSVGSDFHPFRRKEYLEKLIDPSYVEVSSDGADGDGYSGNYDSGQSPALKAFKTMRLASDAQGTSISTAMVKRAEMEAQSGYGKVYMDVALEMYDYVAIIDPQDSTTRYGNVGYIRRVFDNNKDPAMYIGFGKLSVNDYIGVVEGNTSVSDLAEQIDSIWNELNNMMTRSDKPPFINVRRIESGTHVFNPLGTWTNNSDDGTEDSQAGSVHWAGVKLVYKGVEYDITDGYTDKEYIWWDVSTSKIAFQVTDTRPTEIGDNDLLVAVNTNGIVTIYWNSTIVDGGYLRAGTVEAQHIKARTITASEIKIETITVSEMDMTSVTLDTIGEGSTHKRVLSTHIYEGGIKVSSITGFDGTWYSYSGVTIDAEIGITFTGAQDLIFNYGGGTSYIYSGVSGHLNLYHSTSGKYIVLDTNGGAVIMVDDVYPITTYAQVDLGNPDEYYDDVYCDELHYKTQPHSFDEYDDIELIKNIKTKKDESGNDVLDYSSFPSIMKTHKDDKIKGKKEAFKLRAEYTKVNLQAILDDTPLSRQDKRDKIQRQIDALPASVEAQTEKYISRLKTDKDGYLPHIKDRDLTGLLVGGLKCIIERLEALEAK